MTPAPLGKVVGWSVAPWPSLDELKTGMPDAPLPRKTVGSRAVIVTPADYARARVCVDAMEGVAEPVETMRAVVKSLTHALEYMSLDRIRDAQSWGFVGTYPELVAHYDEPQHMANLRALLLTLNKSQP